ncbi:hypothetical protein EDB81DRAFT_777521 [Dactylonectria macrodidyma]|uniref:Uncharacterized protein n=1 Tax=Dactylonectria macrodidyma TaxID=307937 RepID=A0A9P9FQR3_9HYPO|nr:hypothetical protein EDB81DRAFT_777521 [Dactylonectria macrodidyma]
MCYVCRYRRRAPPVGVSLLLAVSCWQSPVGSLMLASIQRTYETFSLSVPVAGAPIWSSPHHPVNLTTIPRPVSITYDSPGSRCLLRCSLLVELSAFILTHTLCSLALAE